MVLTVHHMERSQSERVVFLCEELGIPYELKTYPRNESGLAPEIFKKLHPAGTAPVIEDDTANGKVVLAESGAILEYILNVHGNGKLALKPSEPRYGEYLEWFHYVNGTIQANMSRKMLLSRVSSDALDSPFGHFVLGKIGNSLSIYDKHLANNKWLVGDQFTAADVMTTFTFTTMRGFAPYDLSPYPNILRYLKDIGSRPAYQSTMKKGDPQIEPYLGATVEPFIFKGPSKD